MPLPVMTVETLNRPSRRPPAEIVPAASWPAGLGAPELPHGTVDRVVVAHVNHNRWLGDCPVCGNAQVLARTDRRYCCAQCFMGWFRVEWPTEAEAIERVLMQRPDPSTRNWRPGTSVVELAAENETNLEGVA